MKRTTLFSSCCGLLLAGLSLSVHAASLPGPLVDAKWLHDHIDSVTIVDVREDAAEFAAKPRYAAAKAGAQPVLESVGGHVPGAHLILFGNVRATRKIDGREIKAMLPERAAFEAMMQDAGVPKGKPIVIASAGDSVNAMDMAARLYWSMKTYGDERIAILNGGTAAWLQAGYPVSMDAPGKAKGNWTARAENHSLFADSEDVAHAANGHAQLVDARSTPQYLGIVKKPVVLKYGHIEGAHSFPTDAISSSRGIAHFFMTPAQYRSITAQLGIKDDTATITYCNTGHLASGAWFVMSEVLGNRSTRLYDGSMLEWTAEDHPVAPAART